MFAPSGERSAAHDPADVSVLQEDDGILLPGEKRRGGGGGRRGGQVQIGHHR